jgi:hypothetical protein
VNEHTHLELDMQEMESLDAPGFWSSFVDSVTVTAATVAVYT